MFKFVCCFCFFVVLVMIGFGLFLLVVLVYVEKCMLVLLVYLIFQLLFNKLVYVFFKEKCGCEIVVEIGNNVDCIVKFDVCCNNLVVDLVLLLDFGMFEVVCKGLVQLLDYVRLKNYSQIYFFVCNFIGGNYVVGYIIYLVGLVYCSDKMCVL